MMLRWTKRVDCGRPVDVSQGRRRVLVVFSDQTGLWWLRFLRRGFRHCFVMIQCAEGWVLYNPLSNGTQIDLWPKLSETAISTWLEEQGFAVIPQRIGSLPPSPLPWVPFTCVEAVKRALRLRARHIRTPWQLYRFLKKTI